MLVQIVDLLLADRCLHDDRGQRVETSRVDLTGELSRLDVEDTGEAPHELVAACGGNVAHPELDRRPRDVRDDRPAAAVEDGAAGSLHADETELVRLRGVQVLVAGQHLERPEAEEQDDEDEERERPEDRDAQCELRRQPVRLADAGVGRQESSGRRALLLVRPRRHRWRSTSTSADGSARCSSPTIARTRRWTGSARMRFRTNAGASAVRSACRATTSSASR